MGKQNILYEKATALNEKVIHAKATGAIFTESKSREISILAKELQKILNNAMKKSMQR